MAQQVIPPTSVGPSNAVDVNSGTPTTPGVDITGSIPAAPNGGGGLDTQVTQSEVPGFLTTIFDKNVVKQAFSTTPINSMTREIGFRNTKSMEFGYWSHGLRETIGTVKTAFSLATVESHINASGTAIKNQPSGTTIEVENAKIFDPTDQIMFVGEGLWGLDSTGVAREGMPLNARIMAGIGGGLGGVNKTRNEITVQFLNADKTLTIPAGTEIIILGHALANTDAQTIPHASLPEPKLQYMQKFMTEALVENIFIESQKEANWGMRDIIELNNQEFIEEIEKSYIFSIRSKTTDVNTSLLTYTCAGLIQQMLEGGAHYISIPKSALTDESVIGFLSKIFVGNTGSTQRYMYSGMEFSTSLFSLKSIQRQLNVNDTVRKFEYDFSKLRLFAYTLLHRPHPLLDKYRRSNWAIVLDRKYVERHVFRPMIEDQKDLMDLQLLDAKNVRCCEISSILLKYPQCHAIIVIVDDTNTTPSSSSSSSAA